MITREELSSSLRDYLAGFLTEDQVNAAIKLFAGDKAALATMDKSSLVNAINENKVRLDEVDGGLDGVETELEQNMSIINGRIANIELDYNTKINEVASTGTTVETVQNKVEEMAEEGLLQAYTIGDNTIEIEKLKDSLVRINKVNYRKIVDGTINQANGTVYNTGQNYRTTEHIKIDQDDIIRCYYPDKETYITGLAFYNNGSFVSYTSFSEWSVKQQFTVPSGVNSCRFSFVAKSGYENIVMLTVNRNDYEDFKSYKLFELKNQHFIDKSISPTKLDFIEKVNYFNCDAITQGNRLDTNGNNKGGVTAQDYVSDFIKIPINSNYVNIKYPNVATFGTRLCFYDNTKFLSYVNFPDWSISNKVEIPANATRLKFDFNTSNDNNWKNTIMVVFDRELPEYFISFDSFTLKGLEYINKETSLKLNSIYNKQQNTDCFIPGEIFLIQGRDGVRELKLENMLSTNNLFDFYVTKNGADIWSGSNTHITIDDKSHSNISMEIQIKNTTNDKIEYKKSGFVARIIGNVINPISTKNILMIGDSFTDNTQLSCEVKNILVNEFKLTNLNFIGSKTAIDGDITCKNEGNAGYTIKDYIKTTNRDGRGEDFPNPFLNGFSTYASNNNVQGGIDYCVIELGVNDILVLNSNIEEIKTKINTLINNVRKDYPDCKIFLVGQKYVGKETLTVNDVEWNKKIMQMNNCYQEISQDMNCKYVDIGLMFDKLYGSQLIEVPVYKGSEFTKLKINDWLHPSKSGYYMIAENIAGAIANSI